MLKTVQQALFSTGLQMPKFIPVETQAEDYEVRNYDATKWASTSVSEMDFDSALNKGFMRLFNYIQGNNDKKMKVEMTAPVTCLVQAGEGPFCKSSFTISFYVPEEHQCDPPKPTEADVFIEDRKDMTVFVRTFGGFANAEKYKEELMKLSTSLTRDGQQFEDKMYYTAGYDSPFKIINRRNEVWLIKKH
ncbi:heme-binding protein 2 [Erpetoichthys calabaricus]|uniref:Heme-binding protein 2 n=1 Tax=Erpetoichthys calabaricus TaxID=27687 RepID=A0A8C4RXG0_ERPCA|nr:heme-binding protein 2 [Erpetoichthys calabaricus]